jgi:hypothetical protein
MATTARLVRSPGRVMRLAGSTAFVAFSLWRSAQILVRVPAIELQKVLGVGSTIS